MDEDSRDFCLDLLEQLQAGSTSIGQITKRLGSFPVLGSEILHYANSMEFGLDHEVKRIDHAIAIVGLRRVRRFFERKIAIDGAMNKLNRAHVSFSNETNTSTTQDTESPDAR